MSFATASLFSSRSLGYVLRINSSGADSQRSWYFRCFSLTTRGKVPNEPDNFRKRHEKYTLGKMYHD